VLGSATETEIGQEINTIDCSTGLKKVRYFSNFYREPESDEVFVGGRLKVGAGKGVGRDQTTEHVHGWMNYIRPYVLPRNSPFPLSYSLFDPSLTAVCSGYRFVHGTMTSFPPSA